VPEAFLRWRLFAKEVESDLSQYHNRDIEDWHTGKMSSRKLLVLTDGLPDESWYKVSGRALMERMKQEEELKYANDVRRMMHAQLHGQKMGAR
jgi:hypothetical protein